MRQLFRTILVIGDEPDKIIEKYSEEYKVEPHLFLKRSEAEKHRENHIRALSEMANDDRISDNKKDLIKEYIEYLREMTELDYFLEITNECTYDANTYDAYTTKNPNSFYKNVRSPQKVFEKSGEESGFCNPFKLYDDFISYSAQKNEIDWNLNHLHNQEIYKSAWELVVDNREPINEQEKIIKDKMKNRIKYFENFKTKEEYVLYSTAFWTYGIASADKYEEIGMNNETDIKWVCDFYDKYIKNLDENTRLTLYEVQGLD